MYEISIPGATLQLMLSVSAGLEILGVPFMRRLFFLEGQTWKSFESGGMIFTHLETLSLFL